MCQKDLDNLDKIRLFLVDMDRTEVVQKVLDFVYELECDVMEKIIKRKQSEGKKT